MCRVGTTRMLAEGLGGWGLPSDFLAPTRLYSTQRIRTGPLSENRTLRVKDACISDRWVHQLHSQWVTAIEHRSFSRHRSASTPKGWQGFESLRGVAPKKFRPQFICSRAQRGTRTPTGFPPLAPQASAYTIPPSEQMTRQVQWPLRYSRPWGLVCNR